jgi:aryl-alcohol dehydrogenase-like predicted oxidoreductase
VDWQRIGTVQFADDLSVRRVGFGGAWLTGPGTYGPPPDLDAARAILRRAVEFGIQLFDTADCYGPETSELLIAEALYPYPDDVVISTKGGRLALGNSQWQAAGRPEHLKQACEGSLRRLRLEAIDLYQLNAVDPDVPLEESLGALVELREAGKIRHIGLCNVNTEEFARAQAATRIASVQDRYDLLTRANDPVIDACTRAGIAFLPWAPPMNELQAGPGSALAHIAAAHKVNPSQVALAWLITRSPVVTPLPGTVIPGWFEEDLAALEIMLSAEEAELLLTGA